ncbi:Serine/arginine repetitive matrix protein isoform 1 [Schistosoma japonicum]|uniref:SJCHGC01247 protein n=1 Tax=Schistosoma japonicum TaxID=6182 RepID=Q5DEY3_SCHJA|nr:SJCHGC01247 protein [Schistosoma japonicum]KAH8872286.1 Serine/arginine repetitive matrix protein 2 [Schistosoma japonicum]KAH8872287.1 Serine/arginine repetitive matrix protein 2 [Schistosoma japonicum]KAH8872288.1 Serine/arginine repetitive matrix protein 2 [Schistosoma japonicum]TNN07965.1 Serine/arginine repetitive matrix protein isoform 1 [Schistosoma japonicum]
MYNGIGLPTPRGSGTNGYVQKNLAFISNFKEQNQYKTDEDIKKADALLFKEPNKEILEHERKRKIEVKCFEMEQEMEEQGYTQGEIEFRVSGFRKKLLDELKASETKKVFNVEPFEISQSEHGKLLPKGTHETAAVNILKNTVFKEALGIGEQFQDGNSVELAVQRKKDDAETKRLVEAQKELKTLDSSDNEVSSNSEDKEVKHKLKKKKKSKKLSKRRKHSPSDVGGVNNDDGSGEFNVTSNSIMTHKHNKTDGADHKQHKSSKKSHSRKHKHSHSKERKHHHH